jgi:hypothetical protein
MGPTSSLSSPTILRHFSREALPVGSGRQGAATHALHLRPPKPCAGGSRGRPFGDGGPAVALPSSPFCTLVWERSERATASCSCPAPSLSATSRSSSMPSNHKLRRPRPSFTSFGFYAPNPSSAESRRPCRLPLSAAAAGLLYLAAGTTARHRRHHLLRRRRPCSRVPDPLPSPAPPHPVSDHTDAHTSAPDARTPRRRPRPGIVARGGDQLSKLRRH